MSILPPMICARFKHKVIKSNDIFANLAANFGGTYTVNHILMDNRTIDERGKMHELEVRK